MAKKKKLKPAPRKSKLKSKKKKKLAARKASPKKQAQKKKAVPRKPAAAESPGLKSPIPTAWLVDVAGRELALDSLAAWVVSTLQAAQDDAAARETLRVAIEAFYDIRQAAKQARGTHASHFFIVHGVGLEESNRPVPWQVLAETVSQERLNRFSAIFDEEERLGV